jgi:hypothetical protein
MIDVETVRSRLRGLVRATPFRPFAMTLTDGDRISVERPEVISFDGLEGGSPYVVVMSARGSYKGRFSDIWTVAELDPVRPGR